MIKKQKFPSDKYLSILGLKKSKPDYDFLGKIIKAHLIQIPFENISKLLLKKRGVSYIPTLEEYLDVVEKYNLGGTCYANNYYLNLLLKFLGFDAKLCGADMRNPDVHLISIVTIDKKEFIVDCGYAAPFFDPLPRDLKIDYSFYFGEEKYIIKPQDSQGLTTVEQYYRNDLQHWYTAKPRPRKIEDFKDVIEDSYGDEATFMNTIRITKFTDRGALILKNLDLTEVEKKITRIKLERKDLPGVVEQKFGMPADLVSEALSHMKDIKDIYD